MQLSNKVKSVKPSSTIALTAKSAEYKAQGLDVVAFAAGEPDFDTPDHIKEAAILAINQGKTKYTPAAGTMDIRKAVCDKLEKDNGLKYLPEQIVVSNGAKQALVNAFLAIINEGDEVIIPGPFWLSYAEMVKIAGGVPVVINTRKEDSFVVDPKDIEDAITPKTKAIIFNTPSNPTGMIYTEEAIRAIADIAVKHDIFVISDEIYEKLIYVKDKKHVSIASLGPEIYDRTIVVNGVSKSFSMTGWRIGYTASNLTIAKLISSAQSHMTSGPCSISQAAAVAALTGPQDCVEEMRKAFEKRMEYIYERVNAMDGLSCLKPEGAFYLFVDVSGVYGKKYNGKPITSAAEFAAYLLEDKLVVAVPCADFAAPDYLRFSYAVSIDTIKKGMDRIEAFLGKLE
ncbi:MAG: pyridoxal phosphate-dependent aminotransferase [Firmicutes bacterium]|nr:pyridoxal phosphate-dependent aminotransferase [Bacillota bacterium]MBQ7242202.1 pyridoxal phosphate-dependent aminotransferase [Bacillota bacterium]MBR2594639.1 pyridoxal phosphate-dependent aminotransferase [Bacillota bacterium]